MLDYLQTKAKIEKERLLPWASSTTYEVLGVKMKDLTLSTYVDLDLNNNFIVSPESDPKKRVGDIVSYIWRHSEEYKSDNSRKRAKAKRKLMASVSKHKKLTDVAESCIYHFMEAMKDTPESSQATNDTNRITKMSASPSIAYIVDEVCSEYSMSIQECMDTPIKVLFQLMRCIRLRKMGEGRGGKVSYSEPQELKDVVKAQLKKQMEMMKNGKS